MKQILLLLLMTFTIFCYGQEFKWAYSNGGHTDDKVYCSELGSSNEVYIAGTARFGDFDWLETFIAKLDSTGNMEWVYKTESSDASLPTDLVIDSNGDIIVTGYYERMEFDTIVLTSAIQPRMFLAKFSSTGKVLWAKDFGTNQWGKRTYCNAIDVDANNNIYVTGTFEYNLILDSITLISSNSSFDIFVASFDENGNPQWARNYGSKGDDWAYDLKIYDNKFYLAGAFTSYYPFFDTIIPIVNNVYVTGFIASFNLDGTINWLNTGKTPDWSYGEIVDLAVDSKGNVYGFGQYQGLLVFNSDTISDYGSGDGSGVLVKLDSFGNSIWAKRYNIAPYEFLTNYWNGTIYCVSGEIECDKNDNLLLASSFKDSLFIDTNQIYSNEHYSYGKSRDVFIVKYNEIGYPQWYRKIGEEGDEYVTSLSIGATGQILVGGLYSSLTLEFDTTTVSNNSGNRDLDFYITVLSDTSINICPTINAVIFSEYDFICEGKSLDISCHANYGNSYLLYQNDTEYDYSYKKTFSLSEGGNYQYIVNSGLICQDTTNVKSILLRSKPDALIDALPDSIICSYDSAILNTTENDDYEYSWFFKDTLLLDKNTNIIEVNEIGKYEVNVYDGYCYNSDSIIVISGMPEIDLKAQSQILCPDSEITLSTTHFESYSYTWLLNDTILDTNNSILISKPGLYSLTVSNQYCNGSDSIMISAGELPMPIFLEDTIVTNTLPITISLEDDSNNIYTWYYNDDTYISGWSSSYLADKYGMYKVSSYNQCGAIVDTIYVISDKTVGFQDITIGNSVHIYPNPSSGIINLIYNFDKNECQSINLLNSYGQKVKVIPCDNQNNKQTLYLTDIQSGLYYLVFVYDKRNIVNKIVLK